MFAGITGRASDLIRSPGSKRLEGLAPGRCDLARDLEQKMMMRTMTLTLMMMMTTMMMTMTLIMMRMMCVMV